MSTITVNAVEQDTITCTMPYATASGAVVTDNGAYLNRTISAYQFDAADGNVYSDEELKIWCVLIVGQLLTLGPLSDWWFSGTTQKFNYGGDGYLPIAGQLA
jgi:hypothetical protein